MEARRPFLSIVPLDLGEVWVVANLREEQMARIRVGQPVHGSASTPFPDGPSPAGSRAWRAVQGQSFPSSRPTTLPATSSASSSASRSACDSPRRRITRTASARACRVGSGSIPRVCPPERPALVNRQPLLPQSAARAKSLNDQKGEDGSDSGSNAGRVVAALGGLRLAQRRPHWRSPPRRQRPSVSRGSPLRNGPTLSCPPRCPRIFLPYGLCECPTPMPAAPPGPGTHAVPLRLADAIRRSLANVRDRASQRRGAGGPGRPVRCAQAVCPSGHYAAALVRLQPIHPGAGTN